MLKITKSDVVRQMRPFQRELAHWIIDDVQTGNAPFSFEDARNRYVDRLGPEAPFDTGKGWSGDLREASLWTLLHNGFSRAGMVKMLNNQLIDWSSDTKELWAAANVEIEYGGNVNFRLGSTHFFIWR